LTILVLFKKSKSERNSWYLR